MTGYTDTYFQYDKISTGNCGDKSTYTHIPHGAISSSDCRQKCDNDVNCTVYATKESNPTNANDDFCVTYSKCNINKTHDGGTQWNGAFFRKNTTSSYSGYQTTNTSYYNQAKECINLNDPRDKTTNKVASVVSRK